MPAQVAPVRYVQAVVRVRSRPAYMSGRRALAGNHRALPVILNLWAARLSKETCARKLEWAAKCAEDSLAQHEPHGRFVPQRVVAHDAVFVVWFLDRPQQGGVHGAVRWKIGGWDRGLVFGLVRRGGARAR